MQAGTAARLVEIDYETTPPVLGIDNPRALLTDSTYQRAGSAAARKQAAERFLTTWADGWSPPTVAREELYARAQQRAKAATRPPALY